MSAPRALFTSWSVDWRTPRKLYEALDSEFHFTLDPCPLGGAGHPFVPWTGHRVYCNPPYGPAIVSWISRWREAEVAVFLLPARTDTAWFHVFALPHASEIRFLRGRLKFGDDPRKRATFPSNGGGVRCLMPCPKRAYTYRIEAELVLALARQNGAAPGRSKIPIRAYLCPDCQAWHLTSRPERGKGRD